MIEELTKDRHETIEGGSVAKIGRDIADENVVPVHLDPVAGNHLQHCLIGCISRRFGGCCRI